MKENILRKGFWTLLNRSIGAALVFFSTLFFARVLKLEEFGLFSLGLTTVTIISVVVRGGMDNVVLKQVAAHAIDNRSISNGYIYYPLMVVIMMALFATAVLFFLAGFISESIFVKSKLGVVLQSFSWLILPMSMVFILSEANKALGRAAYAAFFQSVLPPTITLLIVILLWHKGMITLSGLICSVVIGYGVAAVIFLFSVKRRINKDTKVKIQLVGLFKQGLPMLWLSIGALVMSWSDTIILGIYSNSAEVGVYYAASRAVLVTTLFLVAANSITAPIFASLYKKGNLKALAKLAWRSSFLLWAVVMLPTGIIFFYSEWVMGLFGQKYVSGAPVLVILGFGQLINVSSGSVGCLLTMTGNEKIMRDIILCTAVSNIFLNLVLVQEFGTIGVAYATASSVIMWNIWAIFAVKKNLGFWVFKYHE